MKRLLFAVGMIAVFSFTASATLVDIAPDWRGGTNSTYQMWSFDDDTNPTGPTEMDNQYTPPAPPPYAEIFIETGAGAEPTTGWLEEHNAHQGVWKLYGDGQMLFYVPNNPQNNDYKIVRFQLTYSASGDLGAEPEFFSFPQNDGVTLVSKESIGNDYYHAVWDIIITPNPPEEWISITPHDCSIYVDKASIDTICVPEPATLGLLVIGGFLLRKRK